MKQNEMNSQSTELNEKLDITLPSHRRFQQISRAPDKSQLTRNSHNRNEERNSLPKSRRSVHEFAHSLPIHRRLNQFSIEQSGGLYRRLRLLTPLLRSQGRDNNQILSPRKIHMKIPILDLLAIPLKRRRVISRNHA